MWRVLSYNEEKEEPGQLNVVLRFGIHSREALARCLDAKASTQQETEGPGLSLNSTHSRSAIQRFYKQWKKNGLPVPVSFRLHSVSGPFRSVSFQHAHTSFTATLVGYVLTKRSNSRAPGAIGEWNGTVRIGAERNG